MPTPDAVLDFLRANLGLGEYPSGSNHNWITEWAGLGDVAWCAETVSRALNEAWGNPDRWQVPGVAADYSWGTAYVPSLRRHFIDAGRYHNTPEVGDVVIYTWGPGEPIGDHTGIVEQVVGDGTIVAIEGNADNQLERKRRTIAAVCDGFGRPPYSAPPPPTPTQEEPMSHVTVRPGERQLIGVPIVGGGAGVSWAAVTVTAPAPGAIIDLAQVWPSERKIDDLHEAKSFAGIANVAMQPGDEAVEIINASPTVVVTVMVESGK